MNTEWTVLIRTNGSRVAFGMERTLIQSWRSQAKHVFLEVTTGSMINLEKRYSEDHDTQVFRFSRENDKEKKTKRVRTKEFINRQNVLSSTGHCYC